LLDLQQQMSIEQFQNKTVFLIAPIRENILARMKLDLYLNCCYEFKLEGSFDRNELEDLVDKLRNSGLIQFRDAHEKNKLINRITADYHADSFIALLAIVTGGQHEQDLIQAYNQLTSVAKRAFLLTALLHKFNLLTPASWLRSNIAMNWEEFTAKVIKAEGRGILIQEMVKSQGSEPDLYFRTKHPLIAEKLVDRFLPGKDKQYNEYEGILSRIEPSSSTSHIVIDLLKAIAKSQVLTEAYLAKLYDVTFKRLPEDPYFLLHYCMNLQHRKNKEDLKKGIKLLLFAESLFDYRNHRFTHRRGVLNFDLAKFFFEKEQNLDFARYHLDEAKELLQIKQKLDPFSSFGYFDLIKLLLWELRSFGLEHDDELHIRIQLDELFELSNRLVSNDRDRIDSLFASYRNDQALADVNLEYVEYMLKLQDDPKLRPFACILLHNHYSSINNLEKAEDMIEEAEQYWENQEVVKFLFKIYGRQLHRPYDRENLLRLADSNSILEEANPLRYYYFMFVACSYNFQWQLANKYQKQIKSKFENYNAEYHQIWRDKEGDELLFDAYITKSAGKSKAIKLSETQIDIRLQKGNYEEFNVGDPVFVRLHFYLYGLLAEIVKNE
jgi:hypothetical protein